MFDGNMSVVIIELSFSKFKVLRSFDPVMLTCMETMSVILLMSSVFYRHGGAASQTSGVQRGGG